MSLVAGAAGFTKTVRNGIHRDGGVGRGRSIRLTRTFSRLSLRSLASREETKNENEREKMKAVQAVRKSFLVCLVGASMAAFAALPAEATTYYVSQSSGNDSWTGKAPTQDGNAGPWKTLAKASGQKYKAGDRLLLKCGDTWNEKLRPKGSGTASNPIVIGSYGEGKKPVIDRQDYRKDRIGIHLAKQEGYKIVGIEFARCMTGIYAEYPDKCPTKEYIWIEDCYFHDSLTYGNYKTYPRPRNISLGICFFSWERDNRIVLKDIMIKNCVFRRLASAVWTNSPDNFNKNASNIYNFGNMVMEDCLFEEGYQWQMGIRGVDGGAVRNCVTHDIGRGFRAWNGVAGAMFFRSKNWVFEDSEWGFISIGKGSGDGEAFDFEGNCDDMTMKRCLFHDTDGPGFLLCCYASDGHPNKGILMEKCVINGKSKRPIGLPRCAIVNTTDWTESIWKGCRFYLSKGEALMRVMDPEKDKNSAFYKCVAKNLSQACRTGKLSAKATASSEVAGHGADKADDGDGATAWKAEKAEDQWLQLDFGRPTRVTEFKIGEGPSSSIVRYAIEYWNAKDKKWRSCFNGRGIGKQFVAPVVARTMRKARLRVMETKKGAPAVTEFQAYDDTTGKVFSVPKGKRPHFVGK